MSSISANQVIKDYRIILRRIRKLPSANAVSPKSLSPAQNTNQHSFSNIVRNMYKTGRLEAEEARIASCRANAHSYAVMVGSIEQLKYLRYLDSGEKLKQSEMIRATAARVGLGVPQLYDELNMKYPSSTP